MASDKDDVVVDFTGHTSLDINPNRMAEKLAEESMLEAELTLWEKRSDDHK